MKNSPLLNFSFNRDDKTIHIKREFNADINLVWKAWTTQELLDQWWAPKPCHTETKQFDFRVGGMWHYAIMHPNHKNIWCKAVYKTIEPNETLAWYDSFSDEFGNDDNTRPTSIWTNHFTAANNITTLNATLKFSKIEDIEMMIQMEFEKGFTLALDNLDKVLLLKSDQV